MRDAVHVELVLKNTPEAKERVAPALEEFAREHQIPRQVIHAVDLSLEEHLTNILNYAYTDGSSHLIVVRLELHQNWLTIQVEDDGIPFDPLKRPLPDTSVPLEQKPVGGLGIYMIRKLMDEVAYARDKQKNILRLRKKVS